MLYFQITGRKGTWVKKAGNKFDLLHVILVMFTELPNLYTPKDINWKTVIFIRNTTLWWSRDGKYRDVKPRSNTAD